MIGSFSPNHRRRTTSTTSPNFNSFKPSLHVWVEAGQLTPLECDQFVREMNRVSGRRVFIHEGNIKTGAKAKAQAEQDAGIVYPDALINLHTGEVVIELSAIETQTALDAEKVIGKRLRDSLFSTYTGGKAQTSEIVEFFNECVYGTKSAPTTPRDTDIPIDLESYHEPSTAVPTINLPTPVKRGRGRPRKNPLPTTTAGVPVPEVAKQ